MPRRNLGRAFALRPVQTYKNVIDTSGAITAASVSTTDVAIAVETNGLDQKSNEVPIGGRISAMFVTLYVFSDTTESGNPLVDVYWWKNPANALTAPTPGNTGASNYKRFIFHEEKGLAGNRTTGSPMIFKGVLKIPRQLQRFSLGDKVQVLVLSPTAGRFCLKTIYRVYG